MTACFSQVRDSDYRVLDRRESLTCVLTGYTILYCLHSYFLWLNALALNTWLAVRPTSRLALLSERTKADQSDTALLGRKEAYSCERTV